MFYLIYEAFMVIASIFLAYELYKARDLPKQLIQEAKLMYDLRRDIDSEDAE